MPLVFVVRWAWFIRVSRHRRLALAADPPDAGDQQDGNESPAGHPPPYRYLTCFILATGLAPRRFPARFRIKLRRQARQLFLLLLEVCLQPAVFDLQLVVGGL